jgi:recombinational DNA repair ATPase RecF
LGRETSLWQAVLFLSRLVLTDFRNYAALTWRPEQRLAVITGPNGSGKTNLLEAISLLGPGRGFSRSKIGEMARRLRGICRRASRRAWSAPAPKA